MVESRAFGRGRGRGVGRGVGNQGPPPLPAMGAVGAPLVVQVIDPYPGRKVKMTDTEKSVKLAQLEAQQRSQSAELARLRAALLSTLAAKKDGGSKGEECLFEVEVLLDESMDWKNSAVVPADVAPKEDNLMTVLSCKASEFMGKESALSGKEWIGIMERTFALGKFTGANKVNYAVRRLGGSALLWWDTVEMRLPADDRKEMTWTEFVERFSNRFDIEGAKPQVELTKTRGCGACHKVHQGPCNRGDVRCRKCGMTGHFAIDCRGDKVNPNLSVNQVVASGDKRKWEGPSGSSPKRRIKYGNRASNSKGKSVGCTVCHKVHQGPCNKADVNCHKCRKNGHFGRDCPVVGIICYNCQDVGHVATQCPKPKRNVCQRP